MSNTVLSLKLSAVWQPDGDKPDSEKACYLHNKQPLMCPRTPKPNQKLGKAAADGKSEVVEILPTNTMQDG